MMSAPLSRRANASVLKAATLALGLLAALPALAKQDDRNKPMNVENANSFNGFQKPNSISTLTGNVIITQGTLKLTGDLAKVYFDAEENISRIVVTGKPAHVQQLDDSNNLMQGDAATLDYDNINGIAVLTGNAVVKQQGRGEAHGDKLTYNTQTSEMTGSSGTDGRVHMTFLPKNKQPAGAPAKPAPAQPAPTGGK
ncbi:lipopolysaccharide transport periplasmic protein LptA [Frateuria defendens]|uniref:lipopolysaccharide transport periplasmic protein LptA n=1 Tax=Frateuria defendens TaxID=2219559 RepID=UPI00066FFC3F|nr:lipopolysaccharide transport periplasmic protein LptA [Frateuria defendens]